MSSKVLKSCYHLHHLEALSEQSESVIGELLVEVSSFLHVAVEKLQSSNWSMFAGDRREKVSSSIRSLQFFLSHHVGRSVKWLPAYGCALIGISDDENSVVEVHMVALD
jgi:hypothetical protein